MNPTPGIKRLDITKARQAGYNDNQIIAYVQKNPTIELYDSSAQAAAPQPDVQAQPKTLEGFAGNIGSSLVKNAVGIGSGLLNVLNPNLEKNTVANLVRLPLDAAAAVAGDKSTTNRANALVDFYKKRYGSLENAANTLYNDPTGVALDASVVLGGAGALAKGAGAITKSSRLGSIGTALADTSSAIDPIAQTTKLAGKGLGKIGTATSDMTQGARDASSSFLAEHSIKAKPTQVVAFKDATGQDLGRFMSENNVYSAKDASKAISPLQDMYNGLVRTDKAVPGSIFANNLRQKALDMVSSDVSPAARQVAEKLWKEADNVESMGNVTDTILTNSKTSTYGKVSAGAMTDPVTKNFNKAYGEVGIQTLDQVAPGSAEIGQKLQALREFQDIAKKQSGLGKGAQVFNTLRPGVGGAVVGNLVPGIGPVAGAVIGEAVTNPTVQRIASKTLQNGLPGSSALTGITKSAYQMGKYGTRLSPDPNQTAPILPRQNIESTGLESPQATVQGTYNTNIAQTSGNVNTGGLGASPSDALTASSSVAQKTLTGYTPEKLYRAYETALLKGDKASATFFRQMYTDEIAYQKTNKGQSEKPLSATQQTLVNKASTGVRTLDRIETELLKDPSLLYKKYNPLDQGGRASNADIKSVIDILGFLRTGATLTKEQADTYRALLPTALDSPDLVKRKIESLRQEFQGYLNQKSEVPDPIISTQGLGAEPPTL